MFVGSTAADVYHLFWFLNSAERSRIFLPPEASEERKHVLICVFMSSRYRVWKDPSKSGTFAKTNIWSRRKARVWDTWREMTSEYYPRSSRSAADCAPPGVGLWHCTFLRSLSFSEPTSWFKAGSLSLPCSPDHRPKVHKQVLVQVWSTEDPPCSWAAALHCVQLVTACVPA